MLKLIVEENLEAMALLSFKYVTTVFIMCKALLPFIYAPSDISPI